MRRDDMEACRIRGAGVLLPVSALPSPYGIGTLGNAAYRFIDQLHAAGQTYWQVLPIGPTGFGNSPYQSYSAFAGNPYFIDLDRLAEQGLLTQWLVKTISDNVNGSSGMQISKSVIHLH